MAEIIARIAADHKIELTSDGTAKLSGTDPMTPEDAAFLARGILACAATQSAPNAPPPGTIVGDAHLPPMTWGVGVSPLTGEPILVLSVPPGIELTFVMPPQGAIALGRALVARGEGTAPPEPQRGTVH